MFYVGYHRPTTTLLLYPGLGQVMNGALAELVYEKNGNKNRYQPFSEGSLAHFRYRGIRSHGDLDISSEIPPLCYTLNHQAPLLS